MGVRTHSELRMCGHARSQLNEMAARGVREQASGMRRVEVVEDLSSA